MSEKTAPRIGEIDALRGLAALSVVIYHYTSRYDLLYGHTKTIAFYWPDGHFGVQLFFAISGFVILMTLDRSRTAMDFLFSRFSRLYPAYWCSILLTTAGVFLLGAEDLQRTARDIAVNLTMLQGLFFIPDVDGVYWTLLTELCFYGCMLGVFLAGQLRRLDLLLVPWIGLSWLWWAFPDLSYRVGLVLVQAHIPYFALGILAYLVHAGRRRLAAVLPVGAFALATLLVVSGPAHFAVGLLVAAVLLAFVRGRLGWICQPPLLWLGTISYALYLVHEAIGWSLIRVLEQQGTDPHLAILAALLLAFALAALVTFGVERPAMRWLRRRYRAARAQPRREPSAA